jgi:carboxyl-terminal processing protease
MKISQPSKLIISLTALAIGTVSLTTIGFHLPQAIALSNDNSSGPLDEVWQIVNQRYVDGSFNKNDWQSIRREYLDRKYTSKEQVHTAIREMLKKLGDPYTRFMNPEEFKNLKVQTSGQLVGVGIQLSLDEKTKKLVIIAPIEGTSAAKAGIISEDIIINIDGKSTEGMGIDRATELIRGTEGTKVVLMIQREKEFIKYELMRQKIEVHSVEARVDRQSGGIGYIRLKQFSSNSTSEMEAAIRELESRDTKGYILDLRSNPGGLLYSAIDIARMLINDGKIVSTKLRRGEGTTSSANRSAIISAKKPIVVLVDGGSASASEILAGALQDNKRAQLVGMKTFGKGLVQSVVPLSDRAGMTVTIAKYYTPNGTDINRKGIQPDVAVNLTKAQIQALRKTSKNIATSADLQYVRALELLRTNIAAMLQERGSANDNSENPENPEPE